MLDANQGERLELARGFIAQRLPDGITAYWGFPRAQAHAEEVACAEALGLVAGLVCT